LSQAAEMAISALARVRHPHTVRFEPERGVRLVSHAAAAANPVRPGRRAPADISYLSHVYALRLRAARRPGFPGREKGYWGNSFWPPGARGPSRKRSNQRALSAANAAEHPAPAPSKNLDTEEDREPGHPFGGCRSRSGEPYFAVQDGHKL